MKIIVTGGLWFIGSRFVNLCLKKGHEVIIVDKMTYAADTGRIDEEYRLHQPLLVKDIKDIVLEDLGNYDYIVN